MPIQVCVCAYVLWAWFRIVRGMRIGHTYRFLENRIEDIFDGNLHEQEEGQPQALAGTSEHQRQDSGKQVVRKHKGRSKVGHCVGSGEEKGTASGSGQNLLQIPSASERRRLTIQQWANAYLEECKRRNTLATFKEKRDGFKRFIRYLEKTSGLSPDHVVESFDRKMARKYLAWQHGQRGPNCSNKDRKILTTA